MKSFKVLSIFLTGWWCFISFSTSYAATERGDYLEIRTVGELRQALLDAQSNGQDDFIVLADGIYETDADGLGTFQFIDDEAYSLTLVAQNQGQAVLDGSGIHRVLDLDSTAQTSIEIDGLVLQNGFSTDGAAGLQLNVKNTTIIDSEFLDNVGSAIQSYGDYGRGETILIERSKFLRTRTMPAIVQSGYYSPLNIVSSYFKDNEGAVHASVNYSDASIVNSIFVNNTNDGATRAVVLNGGSQEQKDILNSLFLEEAADEAIATRVVVHFGSTVRNKIYNSVFLGLSGIDATQVFEIHHSLIDKARITGSAFKKNLILDDRNPKFVDALNYNFDLLDGSDLIDNGSIDELNLPDTDFQGNPRIVGDYVDIGPFESLSPTGGDLNVVGAVIDGPIGVSTLAELRAALNTVIANGQDDTILLEDGLYRVTDDGQGPLEYFDNESFQITLKAKNPSGAILDGDGTHRVLEVNSTSATSLVLDGLVLQNGFSTDGAAGLQLNVKNTTIIDSEFLDNVGSAIQSYGDYGRGETILIERSKFLRTRTMPAIVQSGYYSPLSIVSSYFKDNEGAVHASVNYSDASIVNSIFVNNTNDGATRAVVLNGGSQEQKDILNSLFLEEAADEAIATRVVVHFGSTVRNKIYNSVFLGLSGIDATQVFEIHHSLIDKARITGSAFKKNLILDDRNPKFVDALNYNFDLLDGSDLIDNGSIDELNLPDTDFQGNPRIVGDYVDIGPFESLSPTGGDLNVVGAVIDGPIGVSTLAELRAALNTVIANGQDDTILLEDGLYRVTDDGQGPLEYFDNESFQITLKAKNPSGAILDGDGTHRVLEVNSTSATSLVLDGLVLQNGFSTDGAAGMQLNVKNTTIIDSEFLDNVGSAIQSYGDYGRGETILIERSKFLRNRTMPAIVHSGYYSPLSIVSSYFKDNEGAVRAHVNYSRASIQNSIFLNNTSENQTTGVSMQGGDRAVHNSLFLESIEKGDSTNRTAVRISGDQINHIYNSIFLDSANVLASGESFAMHHTYIDTTKLAVPDGSLLSSLVFEGIALEFTDAVNEDFSLQYFSELINAGSQEQIGLPETDFAGNPRVAGNIVDIGPYESLDLDNDGLVDEIDPDRDGDGVDNNLDWAPGNASEQIDSDGDGIGDNSDNCTITSNSDQINTDGDAEGDDCDSDDDNDGYSDKQEAIDGTNPLSPFSCSQGCFNFDIDGDGENDALTDGLLVLRHLLGFSSDALVDKAISNLATRHDATEITRYLNDAEPELDIDGDGEARALTDGLLLIRYLFGISDDGLISGAIGENAERTTVEQIETHISERIPVI